MSKSNLKYKSNIYILNESSIDTDDNFFSKITDAKLLIKHQKRHKFSPLQEEIKKQSSICSYLEAKGMPDPCWGRLGDKYVCKCINIDCPKINQCRKNDKVTKEDIKRFNPLNNPQEKFEYDGIAKNNILYRLETNIPYKPEDDKKIYYSDINKITEYLYSGIAKNVKKYEIFTNKEIYEEVVDEPIKKESAYQYFEEKVPKPLLLNAVNNVIKKDLYTYVEEDADPNEEENTDVKQITEVEDIENVAEEEQQNQEEETVETHSGIYKYVKQEDIYKRDLSESFLVNAGPGTGKTYTLIEKIAYLVENNDILGEEILVLSYTNAAVNEIKSRLKEKVKAGAKQTLNNVNIRTFHSFFYFLNNFVYGNEVRTTDWDSTCDLAKGSIHNNPDLLYEKMNIRYFIIDEIQDLTCNLAIFIIEMLEYCKKYNIPVTLLGDSCQAIYNYTTMGVKENIDSDFLYRKLENYYKNYIKNYMELTENHRQTEDLKDYAVSLVNKYRPLLLNYDEEGIRNYINELDFINNINLGVNDDPIQELKETSDKICFMTRNNAQAYLYASNLRKHECPIKISLRNDSMQMNSKLEFHYWISDFFNKCSRVKIDYEYFKKRVEKRNIQLPTNYYIEPEEKYSTETFWNYLLSLTYERDEIDVKNLLNKIFDYSLKIDDPILKYVNEANIEVSTVHKAKGREFNIAYIDKDVFSSFKNVFNRDKKKRFEEYKILYVALTRPKNKIELSTCAGIENFAGSKGVHKRTGKFYRCDCVRANGKKIFIYKNYEIGNYIIDFNSFRDYQKNIRAISENDEIILIKQQGSNKYDIYLANETDNYIPENKLGETNTKLNDDFTNINAKLPDVIREVYIDGKYAYYDETIDDENKNLNLWTVITFSGLGKLCYNN